MSILETRPLQTRIVHWPTEAGCAATATALARHAAHGGPLRDAFIELHGPLGAGKTTFVRHLLQALGVSGRVKSPTYTVMEPYEVGRGATDHHDPSEGAGVVDRLAISHFDFYRFDDPQEWEDAGFRDVFAAPGLKLAEWPERAAGLLPLADLRIDIEPDAADARTATLSAQTGLGQELLR